MKIIHRVRSLVERGERISADECRGLFEVKDLIALAKLARVPQERRFGRRAFYRDAYVADYRGEHPEFFISEIETAAPADTAEIIVRCRWNGAEGLALWKERLAGLAAGRLPIVAAISAGFIARLASLEGMPTRDILVALRNAAPILVIGEEAELFDAAYRTAHAPSVISSEEWLAVHRAAHALGMKSVAAMTYSTIDHPEAYAEHLAAIRALQDETGGFIAFVPMALHNHGVAEFYLAAPTAAQTLRATAIARVFLDNIPHILASPALVTLEIALVALSYGADMIDTSITVDDVHAEEKPAGMVTSLPIVDEVISSAALGAAPSKVRSRIEEARWTAVAVDTMFSEVAPVGV
jgi:aminodeoxyfutalosine synthase